MAKGKREQTQNAESVVNTRQDRNTFITDGGTWSWNIGTGTLAWSSNFRIRRGGQTLHEVVGPGSVQGLTLSDSVAFVDVDRSGGGTLVVEGGLNPGPLLNSSSPTHRTDERVILGVVGNDGKFYMRDGTIFSSGDSKQLGTLNAVTDRGDISSVGAATENVPFSYVVGSNQLAVYVGGVLMEEGLHYTEDSSTTIQWTALGQPLAGERVSFVNIVGGQGPTGGSGSIQTVYDNGSTFTTAPTSPMQGWRAGANQPVYAVGTAADFSSATSVWTSDGFLSFRNGLCGVRLSENPPGTGRAWEFVPLDDGSGDLILFNTNSGQGIRFDQATGAIEHGDYTAGFLAYPGGTWTPDGVGGGLRWAIFEGTIDASGADELIATGLSGIIGLHLAVSDGNRGGFNAVDMANPQFTDKRIAAIFDESTGDVTLAGNMAQSAPIGSHLHGEPYVLIVFYRG